MEREGLVVVDTAAVTVHVTDGRWTVQTPSGGSCTTSIRGAVELVRAALPGLALHASAVRQGDAGEVTG